MAAAVLATYCAMHYDSPHTKAGHSLMLAVLVLIARWYERVRLTPGESAEATTSPPGS